jgi:hypothetical protein
MLAKFAQFFALLLIVQSSWAINPIAGSYQKHFSSKRTQDHWVILGAIERIKGAVKPESDIRLAGRVTQWLWQLPVGHSSDEAFQQALSQIGPDAIPLFDCLGRDCGLSNDYANQVFQQAILYGRDSNQRYWVGLDNGRKKTIWVVYTTQRSNKRVYAYVEKLVLNKDQYSLVEQMATQGELQHFLSTGFKVLKPLKSEQARLSADNVNWIKELLAQNPTKRFALVVHRYGEIEHQQLVERTQAEAQALLDQVVEAGGFIQYLYGYGVGAVAPREKHSDRIEVVELK